MKIAFLLFCVSIVGAKAKLTLIPDVVDIFGEIEDFDVILGDEEVFKSGDDSGVIETFISFPSKISLFLSLIG